jgi:hypothetical protein
MDAELLARSVSGRVRGDAAGLRFVEDDESNYRAILGAGGRKIVLESVVGTVRIHN